MPKKPQDSGAKASASAPPAFDERLQRLEAIVGDLEEGGLSLEVSLERYREGVQVLKDCRTALDGFRRQVEELTREAEGSLRPYPGDPDVAGAGDESDTR
jgi:exodeoxyribonuclease VII small subunit